MPCISSNELSPADARQHGRVGNLVAVEMQDRQHRTVARRVQELVRVPAGGERPGLGFAIADDAGHDQARVVEGSAVGMRERIARVRRLRGWSPVFRRHVAGDAAWPRELAEQAPHAAAVAFDGGVMLGVVPSR
jgi:hypothetical protein